MLTFMLHEEPLARRLRCVNKRVVRVSRARVLGFVDFDWYRLVFWVCSWFMVNFHTIF